MREVAARWCRLNPAAARTLPGWNSELLTKLCGANVA
jgi:hypothetical protein